jgi:hypothetical protein
MDVLLLVTCSLALLLDPVWALDNCNYYQDVAAGESFDVYSPNYPSNYPSGISCTYEAVAPSSSRLILQCNDFSLPAVSTTLDNATTPPLECSAIEFDGNLR